jgi:hypothetical protein
MYKRLFVVAALVITVSSMVGLTTVSAVNNKETKDKDQVTKPVKEEKSDKKVTICHRTNAANNPYREITVSVKAVDGEGNNDHTSHEGTIVTSFEEAKALKEAHQKWGDIIPADFNDSTIGDYPGKDILLNGCVIPKNTAEAMIDYDIVCEVATQTAVVTFTNTGNKAGSVTLNTDSFKVKPAQDVVKNIAIAKGGTLITITIGGETVFSQVYTCEGGQGTVDEPETPTTPVTPTTPNTPVNQAGQSGAVNEAATIASLPYTAGSKTGMFILAGTIIATVIAIIGTIVKSAYLKQI